jgi:hypothetical protein
MEMLGISRKGKSGLLDSRGEDSVGETAFPGYQSEIQTILLILEEIFDRKAELIQNLSSCPRMT